MLMLDKAENELVSLYIAPDFQGLGIGQAAVAFAISALDQSRDIKLTVLCRNERAKRLYARFGFQEIAETRVLDPERNLMEETRVRKPGPKEE